VACTRERALGVYRHERDLLRAERARDADIDSA
jgi:hypothetical protein